MNLNIIARIVPSKQNLSGLIPIYIFVYDGAKTLAKISTGHRVSADQWNIEGRRVNKKHPNSMLLNTIIEKKIYDLTMKCLQDEAQNGAVDFTGMQKKERADIISFYDFAEKQIKEKAYAKETRRNYTVYLDKLKAFKKTLKIIEINYEFLQAYENYLRVDLKNSNNTVWGNFKFINTMTNDAIKMELLAVNPFLTYKRKAYKQTARTFLNGIEIEKIENLATTTLDDSIKLVSNYFLFMTYTGLRFSDAIRFKSSLHVVNNERVVLITQKTGMQTNIFINDKIKSIITYIDSNPLLITSIYFNRRLKAISEFLEIDKKVSSHVARHSFGTSLAANGISKEVAQGLLAHGNIKSTKIYYHLENTDLDAAMKKLNG